MVPGPESNNNRELSVCISTEHELLFSDGTQVPEPNIVTFMPDLFTVMFFQTVTIEIVSIVQCRIKKQVI